MGTILGMNLYLVRLALKTRKEILQPLGNQLTQSGASVAQSV
jgi:hypothetical protein